MTTLLLLVLLADPPIHREEITVSARAEQPRTESTAAVTVLTRRDIENAPAQTLSELLPAVPGFQILFAQPFGGTLPMVSARGFFGGGEVEYVQLRIDGVPAGDVESGIADWRGLASSSIERIEILRGPGSPLYGDTALGGVVDVRTRPGSTARREIRVFGGSFGSLSAGVHASGIDLNVNRTGGYRAHGQSKDATGRARFSAGPWTIALHGGWRDRQEPGPLTRAEIERDRFSSSAFFQSDREKTARAGISVTRRGAVNVVVHLAARDSDIDRTLLIAAGAAERFRRDIEATSAGASIEGAVGPFHWGVDGARDHVDDNTRVKAAAFGSFDVPLTQDFRLSAGARFDSVEDQSAWSPRIGLNYNRGGTFAFAQWSRAFKAPTLDQLHATVPFDLSNPQLLPQRAQTIEAGAGYRSSSAEAEVVVYHMNVKDEIDFDPSTFRYGNIGDTVHRGVEVSLGGRGRIAPFATYAWTRVGETQLKNIPEHSARAGVTMSLPRDASAQIAARWIGERFLDDGHDFALGAATVIDLRASRRWRGHRLVLDLLNVTNERYSEVGYVLPDFSGGAVPYEFPAAGRAFRFGVEVALTSSP